MKKIKFLGLVAVVATAATLLSSCTDFLEKKKNYGNFDEEIYNSYEGAQARVNALYNYLLPVSTSSITFDAPSAGTADINSKSTEEYGGFSDYVNPTVTLDNTNVDDYIYRENKNISPYGRIRECNLVIEGVENSSLTSVQKQELLGQALFFRAWCYFRLVRIYGGVPIVDHVQNPMIGDSGGMDLVKPRATTKECIDFICSDLELASQYLPARWESEATDYGRVTAGAALALQGRARLLYASPLFNRGDDSQRWQLAYESNKKAIEMLTRGNYGLAYLDNPGVNASGWAKMFSDYVSPEAVFVTLYNNVKNSVGTNYNKNNGWENSIRPTNADGGGGKSTTAQMVDLFPMADGKKPGESIYPYDAQRFFVSRDPRFYRTFAFPGVEWKFSGVPASMTNSPLQFPYSGDQYELWSYAWYADASEQAADNQTGYGADGLGNNNKSVYIRKRTDDYAVNTTPLYIYEDATSTRAFQYSGAPYMEIRYAEVLLNFAEAACGVGQFAEAVDALKQIRQRVGYTGDCGFDASISSDRAKLFAAILYERQIELAYEGKRFDDMRRWLLWDGGVGQAALNSSWTVTGFGGNTCTYLGVTPLNGQRRTGVEVTVATSIGQATERDGNDPILAASIARPAALNLMRDDVIHILGTSGTNSPVEKLYDLYNTNLNRKTTRVDGDPQYVISFQPKYYFIGFKTNMQSMNVTLLQTIGWPDLNKGNAPGTYDPIAE